MKMGRFSNLIFSNDFCIFKTASNLQQFYNRLYIPLPARTL